MRVKDKRVADGGRRIVGSAEEAVSGWPLGRNAAYAHPCAPATFVRPCTAHALRAMRTFHVQQRSAVSPGLWRVGALTIRYPLSAIRFVLTRYLFIACLLLIGLQSVHAQQAGYVVKPGDVLEISVWKEPDLQRQVLVRPDGAFSFPLVGQVDARGKTVIDLNKTVSERLSKYIADAVVTISVQQINGNKIYVLGQVNKPGEFIVNPSVNVIQALSMAGGMTPFAASNDIIVLRGQGKGQTATPFRYADVVRGRNLEQNIELVAGDIVVVP